MQRPHDPDLKNRLTEFAKREGITGGRLNREQFLKFFLEESVRPRAGQGRVDNEEVKKVTDAKTQVKVLTDACDVYKLNNGDYPPNLAALAMQQPNGGPALVPLAQLRDPWGEPYNYDPKGTRNRGQHVDVWFVYKGKPIGIW